MYKQTIKNLSNNQKQHIINKLEKLPNKNEQSTEGTFNNQKT